LYSLLQQDYKKITGRLHKGTLWSFENTVQAMTEW